MITIHHVIINVLLSSSHQWINTCRENGPFPECFIRRRWISLLVLNSETIRKASARFRTSTFTMILSLAVITLACCLATREYIQFVLSQSEPMCHHSEEIISITAMKNLFDLG